MNRLRSLLAVLVVCLVLSLWVVPVHAMKTLTLQGSYDYSFAQEVFRLVNQQRAKYDLSPLAYDFSTEAFSMLRAAEVSLVFSHERPNGQDFNLGENIQSGAVTPEDVVLSWMNSDGHRRNILNSEYTSISIGCFISSSGAFFWTQSFGFSGGGGAQTGQGRVAVSPVVEVPDSFQNDGGYSGSVIKLAVGESMKMNVTVTQSNGQPFTGTPIWESSQPSVARVENGILTGYSDGEADIRCRVPNDHGGGRAIHVVVGTGGGNAGTFEPEPTEAPTEEVTVAETAAPTEVVTVPPTEAVRTEAELTQVQTTQAAVIASTKQASSTVASGASEATVHPSETMRATTPLAKVRPVDSQQPSVSSTQREAKVDEDQSPMRWLIPLSLLILMGGGYIALRRYVL